MAFFDTRVHGWCPRPVNTDVILDARVDARVHGPCTRPVNIGSPVFRGPGQICAKMVRRLRLPHRTKAKD